MESCDVLTLCAGACYDHITDSQSGDCAPVKPTKKLVKRTVKAKPAKTEEVKAPVCAPPAAEAEVQNTVVPDPEAAERAAHPEKFRKGLPAGKISIQCGQCHNVCTIHVDDPEMYDEKSRKQLFKDRGASYNPPLCGFCFRRRPKKEQAA